MITSAAMKYEKLILLMISRHFILIGLFSENIYIIFKNRIFHNFLEFNLLHLACNGFLYLICKL